MAGRMDQVLVVLRKTIRIRMARPSSSIRLWWCRPGWIDSILRTSTNTMRVARATETQLISKLFKSLQQSLFRKWRDFSFHHSTRRWTRTLSSRPDSFWSRTHRPTHPEGQEQWAQSSITKSASTSTPPLLLRIRDRTLTLSAVTHTLTKEEAEKDSTLSRRALEANSIHLISPSISSISSSQ